MWQDRDVIPVSEEEFEVTESQPNLWPMREEQVAGATVEGGLEGRGSSHPNLEFARETGKAVLEDSGTGGVWPMPVGVTLSLLIWPQDDDAVPPGMESLISAPLVKTLEKEEEKVGLWGGPLRIWRHGVQPTLQWI